MLGNTRNYRVIYYIHFLNVFFLLKIILLTCNFFELRLVFENNVYLSYVLKCVLKNYF